MDFHLILYIIFLLIFLGLSIVLCIVMVSSLIGFVITGVPYYRTPVAELSLLSQRLVMTNKDVIYDLGSGNGLVLFGFERLIGARGVGYELTWWTHVYALLLKLVKRSRVQLLRKDFFKDSLAPATIVYCYLYPMLMTKVGEKVMAECKSGTIVISRDFKIPNLNQTDYIRSKGVHELFIYKV